MAIVRMIERSRAATSRSRATGRSRGSGPDAARHPPADPDRPGAGAGDAAGGHRSAPPDRRYQYGLAWTLYGMALQASGQGNEAVEQLASRRRRRRSASTPARPAGSSASSSSTGRPATSGASRTSRGPRTRWRPGIACGCRPVGHRFLGDVLYERDDLEGAIEQYAIVARDYESFHLTGLREAFFGLALAYHAAGRTAESWRALRRGREILLDAGALEHVPVLEAYEAYLALLSGDLPRLSRGREIARSASTARRSTTWSIPASSAPPSSAPPVMRRASLRRRHCWRRCGSGQHARTSGSAGAHRGAAGGRAREAGAHDAAVAAMRRSLATGGPQGYTRTYLDLLPLFTPEVRQLAPRG